MTVSEKEVELEMRRILYPDLPRTVEEGKTKTPLLSVEDCFPYPMAEGNCAVCSRQWKDHSPVHFFVDQKHQAKAHALYDSNLLVICEIEALISRFDRSYSPSALQEKDRVAQLLDGLQKGGTGLASAAWVIMNYQAGATRMLMQVWEGARKPNYGWQRMYNFESSFFGLRLAQLEPLYGPEEAMKVLVERNSTMAADRLARLRRLLESTESAIRGDQRKFDVLSQETIGDKLGNYMAQLSAMKKDEPLPQPQQQQKALPQ